MASQQNDLDNVSSLYGTLEAQSEAQDNSGQHANVSITLALTTVLLPLAIFAVVHATLSFQLHYHQWETACLIVLICLALVVLCGMLAARARKNKAAKPQSVKFTNILFCTGLLAWVIAVILGNVNFFCTALSYYKITGRNMYPSVDPSITSGQTVMDAGRLLFTSSTHLDVSLSMGHRNNKMYCVAPVVIANQSSLWYDFWAVGVDCCSSQRGSFKCGEYDNPAAHSGLSWEDNKQFAYFQLAVQQAQAAFNITSKHPIFIRWMENPVAFIHAKYDASVSYFVKCCVIFCVVHIFLVGLLSILTVRVNLSTKSHGKV